MESTKNILDTISEFNKVEGYKVKIESSKGRLDGSVGEASDS